MSVVVPLKALQLAHQLIINSSPPVPRPDQVRVPSVAAVDPADEPAGEEDHPEDDYAEQSNEGARAEGALVQVTARQRPRH